MEPFLVRLPKEADMLEAIADVCRERGVNKAFMSCIGAVEKAVLGYYHQDERRYESQTFDQHMEILSGIGNISLKDGQPMAHMHLTLSCADFSVIGGHTMPGCKIFACELFVQPVPGEELVRGFDEPTGLPLWT
ncbi:PPC domain-containing DNA-binding protein [Desulfohalovibrio reitneri]|uniref:PPC domain-containing DNA-binding protein n=1 Tax=Desulfohalovibrio reitneri TaxID=1307759 RepID=UPI0004A75806|nr:PPC domain-containing DNA-binding protein [Desulfohalovibrio reitneri]